MPAAGPSEPIIPTAPLTAQMRDSLRAIIGEKGLIEDEVAKMLRPVRGLVERGVSCPQATEPPRGLTIVYPRNERAWIRVARPPELAS